MNFFSLGCLWCTLTLILFYIVISRVEMASAKSKTQVTQSVFENGRFYNPWETWTDIDVSKVAYWMLAERNDTGLPSQKVLEEKLPVLTPDFKPQSEDGIRITWLGHATVLVQFDGLTILTDPIFSPRCGPAVLQVVALSQKRFRPAPCDVKDLPEIHAVIISHSHYDHLDYATVKTLHARFGNKLHWFVPLKLKEWFTTWIGCKNVHELDWWENKCLPDRPDVDFVFTPAQHWSGRGIKLDHYKTLWGSWCILGPKHKFYFAGDTGYCKSFKEIGNMFGPFDLAAIPIGAYQPRWFMSPQHVDPPQAIDIHTDIKSKKSVGIHWGTFALANEYYMEPPEFLKSALKEKKIPADDFITLNHGESMTF